MEKQDETYSSLIAKLVKEALKKNYENETNLADAANSILHLLQAPLPSIPSNTNLIITPSNKTKAVSKIASLKVKIKGILEKDTLKALQELKKQLREDCVLYNEITVLIATYNRTNKYLLKGTIKYQEAHIEFTKVDNSVIFMIDELEEVDLK